MMQDQPVEVYMAATKPTENPQELAVPKKKNKKKTPTQTQSLLAHRKREATAARFIFYPGQKGTMIERIATLIPKNATRLIEPFTGSAAVPAALAFRFREIHCSDTLPSVIAAHQRAIADPDDFCTDIQALFDKPAPDLKARFNALKKRYNAASTPLKTKAALLIYLNRKAALGLVRHNEDGDLSTSWHVSKIGNPPPLEAIRQFSKRLSGKATFTLQDFRTAIALAGPGDFVYCDPPYLPEEGKKITFTGYSTEFGVKDHIDLAALARAAADRGAKVVVSNHDSEFIRATYASADSFTALAVERKAGRKKGEAAKTSAKEILAVWRPKIIEEVVVQASAPKRLRRELAIDPYNPDADPGTIDRRVFELAQANGWTKDGANPDKISFRSFNQSGRNLLQVARQGMPLMRRLVLDRAGRETHVSLHLLAKLCTDVNAGRMTRVDAETAARRLLVIANDLQTHLKDLPRAEVLVARALKHKAEVFIGDRLQTSRLAERYVAVLNLVAQRARRPGSETEHRLLLLAELCADADTNDFRKLCRNLAKAKGPNGFLDAFPPLKSGRSHGVPADAHIALPEGAVRDILRRMV
jgi:DNA adenine methylase